MRWLVLVVGCASTYYTPQLVARGELTLQSRRGLEMQAGGRVVARATSWNGLDKYVGCVAQAREHAVSAGNNGRAATAMAVIGGTLGVLAVGGLVAGLVDRDHLWEWLGGGVGSGVLGAVFSGTSYLLRNRANGHAVDALNYYNDAVGSLGATCDDLRYPPSSGPAPPQPPGQ
jgi:hypothetical protein